MTWDQYWYGPTWMVGQFFQAEKYRQEKQNNEAWLQGIYFAKAISATIGNAFLQKGAEPDQYPDKPFDLTGKAEQEETEDQKEEREEQEATWALAWMTTFVQVGKAWDKSKHG